MGGTFAAGFLVIIVIILCLILPPPTPEIKEFIFVTKNGYLLFQFQVSG